MSHPPSRQTQSTPFPSTHVDYPARIPPSSLRLSTSTFLPSPDLSRPSRSDYPSLISSSLPLPTCLTDPIRLAPTAQPGTTPVRPFRPPSPAHPVSLRLPILQPHSIDSPSPAYPRACRSTPTNRTDPPLPNPIRFDKPTPSSPQSVSYRHATASQARPDRHASPRLLGTYPSLSIATAQPRPRHGSPYRRPRPTQVLFTAPLSDKSAQHLPTQATTRLPSPRLFRSTPVSHPSRLPTSDLISPLRIDDPASPKPIRLDIPSRLHPAPPRFDKTAHPDPIAFPPSPTSRPVSGLSLPPFDSPVRLHSVRVRTLSDFPLRPRTHQTYPTAQPASNPLRPSSTAPPIPPLHCSRLTDCPILPAFTPPLPDYPDHPKSHHSD